MADLTARITIGAALGSTFKSAFGAASRSSEELGASLKKAQLGAAASRDLLKYRKELDQLKRKQRDVGGGSRKLTRQIGDTTRKYKAAAREARQYGIRIGTAARQHREFTRTAREAERALGRLNRQQRGRQARAGLRGKALGFLGAGYAASRVVKSSLGREAAEVRLKTVIIPDRGSAEEAVERSRQHSRDYARRNLSEDVEILGIQYQLSSAGLAESAARVGSEVSARVATVTQGVPEQVAKIMAGTLKNLGDSIEGSGAEEKLRRIGDVLTQTQFAYQIDNFGQLGEGLAEASSGAIASKVSFESTATALGILNSSMVTGGRAGTAFRALLRQLGKASQELDFRIVRDASGELDLLATLEGLETRIANLSVDERESILQKVFGDEGKTGVVPLLESLAQYRSGLDRLKESSKGLVDRSYQDFLESTGGKLKIFKNQALLLAESFAGSLTPAIGAVVPHLTDTFNWVGKLLEANPLLAQAVGGVGLAIAGLKLGGLAHQFIRTLPGMEAAWGALVKINAVALVTAARTKALAVGGAIRSFPGLVGSAATATGRLISFNAVALVTAARTKALAVGGAIKAFGSSLLGLATRAIPVAVVGLKALTVAALSNPFVLIGAAVVAVAVLVWKYWEPIKAFLIGLWPPIKAAFSVVWESIKFAFLNFHPLGLVIKHWEPIKAFFVGLWEWMKSAGAGLVSALVDGITAAPGRVYAAVKALLGPVGRLLPSSDAREGPLSGLTRRGRSIVSTLGEGVRRAGPRPLRRPLAASLSTAAAGLALTLPTLAAPAIPSPVLPTLAAPRIPPLAAPTIPSLAAPRIPPLAAPRIPPLAAPRIPSTVLPTPDSPPGRGVGEDSPRSSRGPVINHYHNRITIHQQAGENAQALADRIIREIEQRQAQRRREELYDEVG